MSRRAKNIALVVLVALVINLPLVHSTWQARRLDSSGVDVRAQVTENREVGESNVASFEVPADGDREQFSGQARLEQDAYDEAVRTREVEVRLLPDDPVVHRVEGEVTSRVALVITLIADLFLVLMVVLLVRFGPRLRPVLVLVATEDLEQCAPGSVLDRIDGSTYVVCGEVETIDEAEGEVLLDLGDRKVRVILEGHRNPAGFQQPVRATGLMIG